MSDELQISREYNQYPDIITYDEKNPSLSSPNAEFDLMFYQTRDSLMDVEVYKNFIKNCEMRFRRSKYYKTYKSYLMSLGLDRCQVMGNITAEDVGDRGIEMHHNILNLFDITLMIIEHTINTVGMVSTFDVLEMLKLEHYNNTVPVVFLSKTTHQMYTNDPNAYIPPEMTFGRWWELIYKYRYGITLDIAYKLVRYIHKYENNLPITIDVTQQEQILSFAYYNEYGVPKEQIGYLPYQEDDSVY